MRKNIMTMLLLTLGLGVVTSVSGQEATDSTNVSRFSTKKNKIEVSEKDGKISVKVFSKSDSTECKKMYEGVFSEGKEYEKWTVAARPFSWTGLFSKKQKDKTYKYYPNSKWAGLGWGFCTITDGSSLNDIDGVTIKAERSTEFFINPIASEVSLYKDVFMFVTGLGVSWKNLSFENNTYLVERNDMVSIESAPVGVSYDRARLRVCNINVPIMLEWQPSLGNHHSMYLMAGVMGGINIFTSQKIKYKNSFGDDVKRYYRGLNVSRFTFDFIAQVGFDDFGIFARYSPVGLFIDGKGPNIQTASLGLRVSF